jgi:hypothetical protein
MHSNGPPLAPVPQAQVAAAGMPAVQPGMMCCACMNIRAWGARCAMRVRVPGAAAGAGAADWRPGLGAAACGRAASCGITPGPGGAGAAGAAVGGCPPVAGPFCAIASDVPPNSSATIARLFTEFICYLRVLAPHSPPDVQENAPKTPSVPGPKRREPLLGLGHRRSCASRQKHQPVDAAFARRERVWSKWYLNIK